MTVYFMFLFGSLGPDATTLTVTSALETGIMLADAESLKALLST